MEASRFVLFLSSKASQSSSVALKYISELPTLFSTNDSMAAFIICDTFSDVEGIPPLTLSSSDSLSRSLSVLVMENFL